jgi:PTH1 family peptidyl-tRNA hydrolase
MKLIVGLGNPGSLYIHSRHNIGFSVVKELSKDFKIALKKDSATFSLSGRGRFNNENVMLAEPVTYMNLSGLSVSALLKKHKVCLEDLLVICDDLDLEFGRLKIRPSGSSAGQRGMESIIAHLGGSEFARLRVGIGRPAQKKAAADYVLSAFTRKEKSQIPDLIACACQCCQTWISQGITESMNIFNQRSR